MDEVREYWRTVYARFNPESTPEDRAWRVERRYSPARTILNQLRGGLAEPRVVLVGTRGTGKTTELYQVADEVGAGRLAVYLDIHEHLQDRIADAAAIDLLKPWEVIALVGLATLRAGSELFGAMSLAEEAEALTTALRALYPDAERPRTIDAGKLAAGLLVGVAGATTGPVALGLTLLAPAAAASEWRLPVGRRTQAADEQDPRVRRLVEAVVKLIASLRREGRRTVLLLDGLDRISRHETAEELFVRSSLLAQLTFDATVLVGPVSLRRQGQLGTLRGFTAQIVHEVPVLDLVDPRQEGPGVAFFHEVWERRTSGLIGPGIAEPVLRRAAYYSGGRIRVFQRIVRDIVEAAYRDAAAPSLETLGGILDQLRLELEEGITRADIDVLSAVMQDPRRLPADRERVTDLLERYLLYPYPNRSTWYYPNPLLLLGPLLGSNGSAGSSS